MRPIMDAPIFSIVIATIGASTIMRSAAGIVYGYDVSPLPTIFSKDPIRLGVFNFTRMDLGVIVSSLLIMLVLEINALKGTPGQGLAKPLATVKGTLWAGFILSAVYYFWFEAMRA